MRVKAEIASRDVACGATSVARGVRDAVVTAQARRWAQLVLGLLVYGIATVLLIRSDLGLGPWDAFHVGLSRWTGLSVGATVVVAGLAVIAASWFIGVRPGPGTIANMILIGAFVDLLLPFTPQASSVWIGVPYHLAGIALTGIATGLYIAPGLGKGPRDGMILGIAERTGWPVRRVRTGIELTVLLLGWLMGARLGIGTILFALGIGRATEWGLRLFGVIPSRAPRAPSPRPGGSPAPAE